MTLIVAVNSLIISIALFIGGIYAPILGVKIFAAIIGLFSAINMMLALVIYADDVRIESDQAKKLNTTQSIA